MTIKFLYEWSIGVFAIACTNDIMLSLKQQSPGVNVSCVGKHLQCFPCAILNLTPARGGGFVWDFNKINEKN